WIGFDMAFTHKTGLVPSNSSFQPQNYAFHTITSDAVGLGRIDHTSTVHNHDRAEDYFRQVQIHQSVFFGICFTIQQAIDLANQNALLNEDRFAGHFDMANKDMQLDLSRTKNIIETLNEKAHDAMGQGWRGNPEPILITQLEDVLSKTQSIPIPQDRIDHIARKQEEALLFFKYRLE
ncbi:MAG: hypothetical protein ACI8Y7_001156, partial [Candidatus Woesearchaeota archaeon]